jgi:hypothetical protein
MNSRNLTLSLLMLLTASSTALAWTVNEKSAAYQSSMEHLQGAQQAIEIARREIVAAQRYAKLPGFQYDALDKDLAQIQERLNLYLTPLQRQRELRTFKPDGIYFNPTLNKESPNEK